MTTEWSKDWIAKGFPWCDTCGEAAVFSELFGRLHTTAEEPWGFHERPAGPPHRITIGQWEAAGREERARMTTEHLCRCSHIHGEGRCWSRSCGCTVLRSTKAATA